MAKKTGQPQCRWQQLTAALLMSVRKVTAVKPMLPSRMSGYFFVSRLSYMQLDHALKIVQTAENYPRGDFNTIKHWGLSIRASVIVLGKDLVPQAWSVFIDRENRWEDMQDEVLQEVNDLAIQTARTLNCPSCYHVHRNT